MINSASLTLMCSACKHYNKSKHLKHFIARLTPHIQSDRIVNFIHRIYVTFLLVRRIFPYHVYFRHTANQTNCLDLFYVFQKSCVLTENRVNDERNLQYTVQYMLRCIKISHYVLRGWESEIMLTSVIIALKVEKFVTVGPPSIKITIKF